MDGAMRKDIAGKWQPIPHRSNLSETELTAEQVRSALTAHSYQPEEPPGLYPEQPTVCSCGASPPSEPDDDQAWWIDHLLTMAVLERVP